MINRWDFDRAAKGQPVSATVYYKDSEEPVVYAARDFDKVKFPARRVTLNYPPGSLAPPAAKRGKAREQ